MIKQLALAAAIVAGAGTIAPASAVDLKMLMSWDDSYSATIHIPYPYVKRVSDASGGKISIKTLGPETVPPFEQLQPLSAGVFDLLFTHGGYHSGATGIGSAIDALVPDPDKRRASGAWEWIDKHYQEKHGVKLIAIPTAATGFHILLRKPLDADGSLKGRKIRGTQVYSGVFRLFGATTVVIAPAEVYTAVDKGVIDGVGWASAGTIGYKHYEVAPYILRPTFGTVSYLILMNNASWKKLSKDEQTVLLDEGAKLEKDTLTTFDRLLVEEDAEMVKRGAKMVDSPKVTKAEMDKAFAEEAWKIALKASGKEGERFYEFAKSKALTP